MSLKRKFQQSYSHFDNLTMGGKQSQMVHHPKRSNKQQQPYQHTHSTKPLQSAPQAKPIVKPPTPPSLQFDEQHCRLEFSRYADPDTPNVISPEGTQQFFEDLGLSIEDVLVIAFAWKMNLTTMGYITLDEWMMSMRSLNVDSIEKLRLKKGKWTSVLNDPEQFKDMYRYTFGYAKNRDQKCMDVEVAVALWTILLGRHYPLVDEFTTFLQEKQPVRVINKDQWHSLLEFLTTVSPDLSVYDETSAWPVLFDEFVEWKRDGH